MASRHTFLSFVQWEIKTQQFLAGLRLLHPGVCSIERQDYFYDGHVIVYHYFYD
jgi:hypothetical protein